MNETAIQVTVTDMDISISRKTKPKVLNPGRGTDPRKSSLVNLEPF